MEVSLCSALGLSHSLGHKLGAKYGIPHGITSVGGEDWIFKLFRDSDANLPQCLTLSPTVRLKAEIASQEDKEHLAGALFYLRVNSTGSIEGDVRSLAVLIDE